METLDRVAKFRCHPNFHAEGAWYDWAMVRFEQPSVELGTEDVENGGWFDFFYPSDVYPCKVLGFVKGHHQQPVSQPGGRNRGKRPRDDSALIRFDKISDDEEVFALVHPCSERTQDLHQYSSTLTEKWFKDYSFTNGRVAPLLRLVPVSSFVDRVFVWEEDPVIPFELDEGSIGDGDDRYRAVHLLKKRSFWKNEFL